MSKKIFMTLKDQHSIFLFPSFVFVHIARRPRHSPHREPRRRPGFLVPGYGSLLSRYRTRTKVTVGVPGTGHTARYLNLKGPAGGPPVGLRVRVRLMLIAGRCLATHDHDPGPDSPSPSETVELSE